MEFNKFQFLLLKQNSSQILYKKIAKNILCLQNKNEIFILFTFEEKRKNSLLQDVLSEISKWFYNGDRNYISFTTLPWPGRSQQRDLLSNTHSVGSTMSFYLLNMKQESCEYQFFIACDLTWLGIEPES